MLHLVSDWSEMLFQQLFINSERVLEKYQLEYSLLCITTFGSKEESKLAFLLFLETRNFGFFPWSEHFYIQKKIWFAWRFFWPLIEIKVKFFLYTFLLYMSIYSINSLSVGQATKWQKCKNMETQFPPPLIKTNN